LIVIALALAAPVGAGHELSFYPGYYPQEIKIDTLPPATAARDLKSAALHAWVGGDPFGGGKPPADVHGFDSLGGYLVVTVNPTTATSRDARCEAARRVVKALGPGLPGVWTPHPYPVTPFHMDYLSHFDLARSAQKALEATPAGAAPLRLRAKGALAERLVRAPVKPDAKDWDASVEEIELSTLVGGGATLAGRVGPPWIKEGWFHARLLLGPAVSDPVTRQQVDVLSKLVPSDVAASVADRIEAERKLVRALTAGCERTVAGFLVRREYANAEFSQGVENIAWDSHEGFNSAVFVRTVKLKDFPWNGWLKLGVGARATAAWNPIGGFSDPVGRLVWAALGDPALLPAPYGASWVPNRVTPAGATVFPGVEVAEDALLPEPGTGLPREVGKGKRAAGKIVYRVIASAFHDGTRMTAADAVYPYLFAARWGVKRPKADDYDPGVDLATAGAREGLAGFKVLRTDSEVKKYSDMTFTYVVPVVEVYFHREAGDIQERAAAWPPWSPVPWHVMALMEEAVKRGIGAFSSTEASRRGIRWLDLARDQKTKDALAALVDGFAAQAWVPPALKRFVTADEAQARWAALKQFHQRRRHFLVTNGPYQLDKWTDSATVLQVFRDFTNPMGVGAFDRFALPRRAYVSRIVARGDRLEVFAEIERVEKFLRDHRIVREPLAVPAAGGDRQDVPLCRYVILDAAGAVVTAGASPDAQGAKISVDLKGKLRPGPHTALVALSLGDNHVNPEVAVAEFRVEPAP
jgi:hypothetical protein